MASSATTTDGTAATIVARGSRLIDISVSGTVTGDVTFERSHDGGTTWQVVETYTAITEKVAQNGSVKDVRLAAASGTPTMTIRAGNAY